MASCPGLKAGISTAEVGRAFLNIYQAKDGSGWEQHGFTAENLGEDQEKLFQFLILVSYDRAQFGRYELIINPQIENSIHRVLINEPTGIFSLDRLTRKCKEWGSETEAEQHIDMILSRLKANERHLNSVRRNAKKSCYAKTFIDCMNSVHIIQEMVVSATCGRDAWRLWRRLQDIHNIGPTIAAKFVKYTLREMHMGNVPQTELYHISTFLLAELHNKEFFNRLEKARRGITNEIIDYVNSEDPMAIDAAFIIDREYCKKRDKIVECPLAKYHRR